MENKDENIFVTSIDKNKQHTFFEQQDMIIYEKNENFGTNISFPASEYGEKKDLISKISFFVELPDSENWVSDVEFAIIKKINFLADGLIIHSLTNDQIYMYGKKNRISGKNGNSFFITIPFFTNNISNIYDYGLSFPLCASKLSHIKFNVEYENIDNLVKYKKVKDYNTTFNCKVVGNFITLSDFEQNKFKDVAHEYLVKLNQVLYCDIKENLHKQNLCSFNHCVKKFKFAFRGNITDVYFNYLPICEKAIFSLNDYILFDKSGFELIDKENNIYEYYFELTNCTDSNIINKFTPCGTLNFSVFDDINIDFFLSEKDVTLVFTTEFYNILRFLSGMCGLAYSPFL